MFLCMCMLYYWVLVGQDRLFLSSERIRDNRYKLKNEIPLNCKKKYFTLRVIIHWHRLCNDIVQFPSLGIDKICLDKVLNSLV